MFKLVSRLAASALAVTLLAGSAHAQTFSGSTVGGPTWNRPIGGNPPVQLSGVGTNVAYDVIHFRVSLSGGYDFRSVSIAPSGWDNYLFLYAGAFNAASPFADVIIGNDDFPNIGVAGFDGVALTAGQDYFAVTSGFANDNAGSYELNIRGNGVASVPSASVPEPASMALMLLGLGVMGVAQRRRRTV